MSTFARAEGQFDWIYTSGLDTSGVGTFNFGAGAGTLLGYVLFHTSGGASGAVVSIKDTVSGTRASGLWTEGSGVRHIFDNLQFLSGAPATPYPNVFRLDLNAIARSGWAIVISGGAANAVRAVAAFNS